MKNIKLQKLILAAMFAALIYVATNIVHIPTPGTNGYLNLGDCMVLLSAFLLGPVYGAAAAGVGSMLADLLLGYVAYAPGTLLIKALMALCAAGIFRALREKTGVPVAAVLGGVVAELVMVFGYFGYESVLLGYGLAAAAGIPGNLLQGAFGLCSSVLLYQALSHVPSVRKTIRAF
ncbi:MAG: ECF transporter S component [Oscillospiraceae bacterium]|nr:ECF transporter S component [Oscillospiraceae bacterium]